MATHSNILAWRIPRTEEPCGLQSMGPQGVGHDRTTNPSTFFHLELWPPTFWAPGTSFMQDNFSTQVSKGGFRLMQEHHACCALCSYYRYISSPISGHQVLGPGGWAPPLRGLLHTAQRRLPAVTGELWSTHFRNEKG